MKTLLPIFFIFLFTFSTFAETYTVTRNDDRNATCVSGVDCSLRGAINAANNSASDDVIAFDANAFVTAQTITLSGTQLEINKNGTLTINGSGKNLLVISGNNQSRVFFISAGEDVTFNDLTISNGSTGIGDGGGILKDGGTSGSLLSTLTINNCNIINNSAGSSTSSQLNGGSGGAIAGHTHPAA